jgi:hypothetical protein
MAARTKTTALLLSSLLLLLMITATLPQIIIQQPTQTAAGQKNNSSDSITRKMSPSTSIYWAKTYGGSAWDYANSVQQTSDGGYIVAGSTENVNVTGNDAWVLKLNSTGSVEWQKAYRGSGYDRAWSAQQTSDGGYIVGGGPIYSVTAGPLWVLKLGSDGSVVWQKALSERDGNEAFSVQETSDGGYIVAGYTALFGPHGGDAWVLKLNSTGSVEWQKAYGGGDDDSAHSVQQTSDGGYIVAGYTESFGAGASDVWVLKLGVGGYIAWDAGSGASTHTTTVTPSDTSANAATTSATAADGIATAQDTEVTPQDTHATVETQSTPNVTPPAVIVDPLIFAVVVGAGALAIIVVVALHVSRRRRK